jgi:hypothetical protein
VREGCVRACRIGDDGGVQVRGMLLDVRG